MNKFLSADLPIYNIYIFNVVTLDEALSLDAFHFSRKNIMWSRPLARVELRPCQPVMFFVYMLLCDAAHVSPWR